MSFKQEEAEGILFDRKVRLVPVPRDGGMITDRQHIGFFMYDGTKMRFVLPKSRSRRTLYPILNQKEQAFFEGVLQIDLNLYAKKDNFWHTFEVVIEKDAAFMQSGITFDLNEPMENLKWRLLKIQAQVAPSWEQRYDNGEYKFALVDEDVESAEKVSAAAMKERAYKFLSKVSNSATKMYDFLCIYQLQNIKTKRPSPEASRDALYTQIQQTLEDDIKGFLNVAEDSEYETKLLVHRAMGLGAVDKKISGKDYYTAEGKFLGNNIDSVVKNLKQPEYQEDYLKLKAIVNSTGK
jgi:hypothetical protein